MSDPSTDLKATPLQALHQSLGARMVPFAGYLMPVQYPEGILKEHLHTRSKAGLFDVSHMGQVSIAGAKAIAALETLVPGDIEALAPLRMRYSYFTNEQGGILDDLMICRRPEDLFLVVNAGCKEQDVQHLQNKLDGLAQVTPLPDRALLALQGPEAKVVIQRLAPEAVTLPFMAGGAFQLAGFECFITRSGYTGEDGFEISVHNEEAAQLAQILLDQPEVKPIGLGARDSLRLEAGLCLYGHDIDTTTTPVEAGLAWAISKRRRAQGGFPGAAIIQKQLAEGPLRKRVGLIPDGRAPAREGTEIQSQDGQSLGKVTSGGFGASLNGPLAMGYVEASYAVIGQKVDLMVRGKALPAKVVAMPFVKTQYAK